MGVHSRGNFEGYALALMLEGRDFSRAPQGGLFAGSGPFLHNHAKDQPAAMLDGINAIHTRAKYGSQLLIPVVPADNQFVRS